MQSMLRIIFFSSAILIMPIGGCTHSFKGMTSPQQDDIIQRYWGSYSNFKQELCQPGDMETFQKLFKEYRGSGFYIPMYKEKLVKAAIQDALPLLNKKISWVESEKLKLEKLKELPSLSEDTQELDEIINANALLKFAHEVEGSNDAQLLLNAKENVVKFRKKFLVLLEKISYLKNIDHPVDHYANRLAYDRLMASSIPTVQPGVIPQIVVSQLALYLKRKFYEDGAMDPDRSKPDLYLRTALDTLTIELKTQAEFFTPEFIRDWEWVSKGAVSMHARGLAQQKLRFDEWKTRLVATKDFYLNLIKQDEAQEKKILTELSDTSANLKDFVEDKLAKVYAFWLKQSEPLKQLYVMETILMHEVGQVDPIGEERKRVLEVVLNRVNHKDYHYLRASDPFERLLGMQLREPKHWWLNVLFRKGEFSFTHFFMNSSSKIFCPDQSPAIVKLQNENLRLALDVLKEYDPQGKDNNIFRYFSRASMTGRIDMTSVWSPPFQLVAETPGKRLYTSEEKEILQNWKQGTWRYLYSYVADGNTYRTIEVNGKPWTMRWEKSGPVAVHYFRDRDHFKFFRLP